MNSDQYQPLQLKGEIMDLEFTIDTDHRKRRRNRTTQSCLNCHTSKRKCDRKRPCQRCIQLGLTGLCVYEIDDPALRDDPTIDETTRLRNRIAELESLVRELRGKPHPRWADANFRDGDPNEKWHSRASKCLPAKHMQQRRAPSPAPELVEDHSTAPISIVNGHGRAHTSTLLTPIKTEATSDPTQQLYRFSASPGPGSAMRYHNFQSDIRTSPTNSPSSVYENGGNPNRSPYQTHPSINPSASNGSGPSSSYSDGGSSTGYPGHSHTHDDSRGYNNHYSGSRGSPPHNTNSTYCPCRTNPNLTHAYISLSQQLQSTLHVVRQITHHPSDTGCSLYRRMVDLNAVIHGSDAEFHGHHSRAEPSSSSSSHSQSAYDSTTPPESELGSDAILSPLSAASGAGSFHTGSPMSPGAVSVGSHGHPHGVGVVSSSPHAVSSVGVGGVSPHEWNHPMVSPVSSVGGAGYNPYFSMAQPEHGVYSHVISG